MAAHGSDLRHAALSWRLGSSAVVIPLVVGLFIGDWLCGPTAPLLLLLCIALAARVAWEMVALLRTRSFEPHFPLVVGCTIAVIVGGWFNRLWPMVTTVDSCTSNLGPAMIAFSLSILILFLNRAIRYREPGHSMETLAAEVLIVAYVGVLLTVTAQLRWVSVTAQVSGVTEFEAGYLALGSLLIAAKSGDIGAYTLGRLFGRRKMFPRLSPAKTWMGAVGALLGAALGSLLWLNLATSAFDPNWQAAPWYGTILFGVFIAVFGIIGDLCESLIKRDVERKDAAILIPGFGGLLDLLDSILYAGPIAYVVWLVFPPVVAQ